MAYRSKSKKSYKLLLNKVITTILISGPNFDTDLPQDVTGVVGQTAYLSCRVFDRENKTVSQSKYLDNRLTL